MTDFYRDFRIEYEPGRKDCFRFYCPDYERADSIDAAKRRIDEIIAESDTEFVVLPEMQDVAATVDDIFRNDTINGVTIRRGRIVVGGIGYPGVVECVMVSDGRTPALYIRKGAGRWQFHIGPVSLTPAMEAALRQVIGVVP